MKLLHTADLHLGKTLHETPLLGLQEKMLNDIHDILTRDDYAALIIAGDVYDRAIPSAEAVSLFSRFLARIREDCPDTAVFIIPATTILRSGSPLPARYCKISVSILRRIRTGLPIR
ncbi:exonuclease subunit SbcD [Treponema sp. OMZ 803]|uniref:exonuclease subunit SbcD n=1 Tax=Treponema sp. OMZ 803 TaxID=120682 RepID=UPI0020A3B7F9|nr:exonuclease subunit SbcD [Treponema sp. OMZ 803]